MSLYLRRHKQVRTRSFGNQVQSVTMVLHRDSTASAATASAAHAKQLNVQNKAYCMYIWETMHCEETIF